MTLREFLSARLDEDEAAAKKATPGPWVVDSYPSGDDAVFADGDLIAGYAASYPEAPIPMEPEDVAHIARHDPARVLREIAAKRAIMRAHEKWCEGRCEATYPDGGFDAAHYWSMKSLAAVYTDHPDYQQEWKP